MENKTTGFKAIAKAAQPKRKLDSECKVLMLFSSWKNRLLFSKLYLYKRVYLTLVVVYNATLIL
jgi:hypothetical protein